MEEIKLQTNYESLPQYIVRNPLGFAKWVIPVFWDDKIPIELYAEVPMHLFSWERQKQWPLI
jgi:hypothetical protein